MTFDITKVCYKPSEELLDQEVYFAQSLQALEKIVTTENGVYRGYITRLDKEGSTMPFCVGGIWVNYIYLTGKKKEVASPKYRPFENVDELIQRWNFLTPCTRPTYTMPLIWVKHKESETVELITAFCKDGVEMGGTYMTWGYFLDAMVFLDNSPCGVEIKEEVE